ncbi:hypothetical protein [Streptodolium elevatio]|uniref:Uncharacterized protein n=1 Tax=Streptodolium elevatio TaxID=3157996 RepID=A0ABV3DK54_9ACTN
MALLRVLRSSCDDERTCPTLYERPDGRVLVQGYNVTDPDELAELGLPPGEGAVIIDADLIREVLDAAG